MTMTIQEFREDQRQTFQEGNWCCTERYLSHYMSAFDLTNADIKKLDGKKLLLVGGGRSPIQKTFDRMHIKCDVTNVDPYITEPKSARTIINKDFVDIDFVNEFDACWALWSLPLYSPNSAHAACFHAHAAIALKPGGKLRVAPDPECIRGTLAANHLYKSDILFLKDELDDVFDYHNMMEFKNTKHPNISAPNPDDIKIEPPQTGLRKLINKFTKPNKTPIQQNRCTSIGCSICGFTAPKLEYDKELLNKYLESVYPNLYCRYEYHAH